LPAGGDDGVRASPALADLDALPPSGICVTTGSKRTFFAAEAPTPWATGAAGQLQSEGLEQAHEIPPAVVWVKVRADASGVASGRPRAIRDEKPEPGPVVRLPLLQGEQLMDKQLRLLDSFPARGADGAAYKVMAYEQLRRVDLMSSGAEQWESTGLTEYRLASGERVDLLSDGAWRVVPTGLTLRAA
jgi:hypothetical protein